MSRLRFVLAGRGGSSASMPTPPPDRVLYTLEDVNTALADATGGETFLLAPGAYGNFVRGAKTFNTPVTLSAQIPASPPVFSSITLTSVTNMGFDGLVVARPTALPAERIVNLQSCASIELINMSISGNDSGVRPEGWGVQIENCADIKVRRCAITYIENGINCVTSSNLDFQLNVFEHMGNLAGIKCYDIDTLLVRNNLFHDWNAFEGTPPAFTDEAHFEPFQIFTTEGGPASQNVIVDGNFCHAGPEGGKPFGWNVGREGETGNRHSFVTITNNVGYGGGNSGVIVAFADDVIIHNNQSYFWPGPGGLAGDSFHTIKGCFNVAMTDNGQSKDYFLPLDDPGWRPPSTGALTRVGDNLLPHATTGEADAAMAAFRLAHRL